MRLIDADAYIRKTECCGYLEDISVEKFNAITRTIDAVEVVRCKDCKFYSPNDIYFPFDGGSCTRLGGMQYLIHAEEYCSKGERKEKNR